MQTFLPYAGFERSAAVLDAPRLGKQRVETLQVLRALELPGYGWANHPAVVMWRGRTPALVAYGLACVRAWAALGHADSTAGLITEFAPEAADLGEGDLAAAGLLPHWFGHEPLHLSHRSALVRKDPQRYRALFGDVPDDLPYLWPGAGEQQAPVAEQGGGSLWVVRAPDAAGLGVFVGEGVVGLDASSGVDVDALALRGHTEDEPAVMAPAAARKSAPGPAGRRRGGKAARQLQALLDEVAPGDRVGVLVEGEGALLVGEVTGGYRFRAGPAGSVVHRRPVAWRGVVPRSAVARPCRLQDPRALFAVPGAFAGEGAEVGSGTGPGAHGGPGSLLATGVEPLLPVTP